MFKYMVTCEGRYWQYDDLDLAIDKANYLGEDASILDIRDADRVPLPKFKVNILRNSLVVSYLNDDIAFMQDLHDMPVVITENTTTEMLYEYTREYLREELVEYNLI